MILTTYDPKKHKVVKAGILENGVFYKKVTATHFMKIEQGYGIQEDVIQKLKEQGCQSVIIDANTNIYKTSFQDWIDAPVKNYGSGLQRFVSINKKTKPKPPEGQLALFS